MNFDLIGLFGNSHSRTHRYGWESESAVERAREQVSELIHCDPKEIVFTSGATESNNLALKGVFRFYREKRPKIVTVQTEHKCVLDSCRSLEGQGAEVVYLPVRSNGLVDLELFRREVDDRTCVASVMFANNEIGVVQPVAEMGEICRERGAFFHTDAAQAAGKIPIDVKKMNIDLMSISGHKIYGPKGVGALYVSRKPRVRLEAVQSGGGQERGMRSGTLPTQLIVGLGAAAELAKREMPRDHERISRLTAKLLAQLKKRVPNIVINGDLESRVPGNLNVSFAYVEGESLLMALKNVAVSSGSACTSASLEPSYVLRALGVKEDMAHTSIRIGIGRFTSEKEIDFMVDLCEKHVARLRELSPLWEMVQEGIDIDKIEWAAH